MSLRWSLVSGCFWYEFWRRLKLPCHIELLCINLETASANVEADLSVQGYSTNSAWINWISCVWGWFHYLATFISWNRRVRFRVCTFVRHIRAQQLLILSSDIFIQVQILQLFWGTFLLTTSRCVLGFLLRRFFGWTLHVNCRCKVHVNDRWTLQCNFCKLSSVVEWGAHFFRLDFMHWVYHFSLLNRFLRTTLAKELVIQSLRRLTFFLYWLLSWGKTVVLLNECAGSFISLNDWIVIVSLETVFPAFNRTSIF